MKNLLSFILLLGYLVLNTFTTPVQAQTSYGHEWINFNQRYWKFYCQTNGVYRINLSKLQEIGLDNVPGDQFAIYHLGKEIPIYVSTNGVFGANDYILVPLERRNMDFDKDLYPSTVTPPNINSPVTFGANPYFLTFATGARKRYNATQNNIPNPPPPNASHLVHITNQTAGTQILGYSYSPTTPYYSSEYDKGEGLTLRNPNASDLINSYNVNNIFNVDPNTPNYLTFTFYNSAALPNNLKVLIGANQVFDTTINAYGQMSRRIAINPSFISSGTIRITFRGTQQFVVYDWKAENNIIPNLNQFSANSTYVNLTLKSNFNYLKFATQNNASGSYYFFDKAAERLYIANRLSNVEADVMFDASTTDRELVMSRNLGFINFTGAFQEISLNQSLINANKNYLILTDSNYLNASPNYVNDYVNYRSSIAGGSHQVAAINVWDLYDLFGYGHNFHPLAIKKFIKYALDNWTTKPEYLFIIGKGISSNLTTSYFNNPTAYNYFPVPTWGHPGTDNLLSSFSTNGKTYPELATGRLSIRTNEDINTYLNKVKEYEQEAMLSPEIEKSLWKKEVLHIAGGTDMSIQQNLLHALNNAKGIIEDSLFQGRVHTIFKRDTDPMSNIANRSIDSLLNNGIRYVTFYGHAAASGFDYNLNSPEIQNSRPRFPIFSAFGCDVANIFSLTNTKTISENYLLSPTGGSIAMIASNNYGWTNIIPNYMADLYRQFAYRGYYKTLGEQYKANIHFINDNYAHEFYNIHTQSFLLQGDPGLMLGNPNLPDLAIENTNISTNPASLNTSLDSFTVKARFYNIGISTTDTFTIKVTQNQVGNGQPIYNHSFKTTVGLLDSFELKIPITTNSVGLTRLEISLDTEQKIQELFETNNTAQVDVHIFEEDLVPILPYEFAIVNNPDIELKASTLNTFAAANNYLIEIDTTELFNSSLKQQTRIRSIGGVIKWKPTMSWRDSTVYYWRTAIDTLINGSIKWNNSSFIYIANGYPGWNQSHYYQFLKDRMVGITLPSNRQFAFSPVIKNYNSTNLVVYHDAISRQNEIHDGIDGGILNNFSCWWGFNTIQIGVFDSVTGEPLPRNVVCAQPRMQTMNEFHVSSAANRNNAAEFLKNIPNGYYVTVKNIVFSSNYNGNTMSPISWQADTAIYGSGNSLYHVMKDLGFTDIDQTSTTQRKTFLFFTKKGDPNYTPYQKVSSGDEKISIDVPITINVDSGNVSSTIIGPAKEWTSLHWQTALSDSRPENDTTYLQIFGIDNQNQATLVYSGIAKDTSLSFINAATYPKIQMSWISRDTIDQTTPLLKYWRVHYQPVPEAALNPLVAISAPKDTFTFGEMLNLKVGIENISDYDMDSMLVRYRIVGQNNVSNELENKRYKPLTAKDTLHANFSVDLRNFPGTNYLFVEANPFNDQPEQYHPNNLGFFKFYVHEDHRNPLLDVTFDGIRILDKDIVSSKPFIKILLNDENLNLLLKDTSLFELQLAPPSNISNPTRVPIDGTICKFFPAVEGTNKNEAYLEYRPELLEDGVYKLIVRAKDNSQNIAGNFDRYEVNFTVDNTPGISNLLNYPNPFSTSTAFVFTLSGYQIPSQLKIQILTVTGKVVREITKEELGPLNIGRNITQYKWDGKDQYGQLLGNGVYLYRVITHNNGEALELRANKNVDKYFKNGYGKMYIMR